MYGQCPATSRLMTWTIAYVDEAGSFRILDIYLAICRRPTVSKPSQQRAVAEFRRRLAEKGLVRFEVTGRYADRELVRAVARRLAEVGPESDRLRAAVQDGQVLHPGDGAFRPARRASDFLLQSFAWRGFSACWSPKKRWINQRRPGEHQLDGDLLFQLIRPRDGRLETWPAFQVVDEGFNFWPPAPFDWAP